MAIFDSPLKTNDQSIDRVLNAGLPVLLVFLNGTAPVDLFDTMNRLAKEHAGNLLLAQIQTKDNPASVQRFRISRTPAVMGFQKGQVTSQAEGVAASELARHAAYILGTGPRPESAPSASTGSPSERPAAGTTGSTTGGKPLPVTDRTFDQEVLQSSLPVLVDFWAPWCGPCRMTDPVLEKLAREKPDHLKVAKVNVDENPNLSQRYNVRSIPMMMLVKNGQVIDQWVGTLPEPAIRSRVAAVA